MAELSKTIVCFGDSNTHGYDGVTEGRFSIHERWTGLLGQYLGEMYHICEEGLGGRTTVIPDPLTEGMSGLKAIGPVLLTHEPVDLLLIMLGTNDTKQRFQMTAENIAGGLQRLIKKAKNIPAWAVKPNILVVAPLAIQEEYIHGTLSGEMGEGCVEKSVRIPGLFRETAEAEGCYFCDCNKIGGMKQNTADYMHLDKQSHRILAETLAKIIPPILYSERSS